MIYSDNFLIDNRATVRKSDRLKKINIIEMEAVLKI